MKNKKLVALLFLIIVLLVFIFNYYSKSFENNEIIKSKNLVLETSSMISFMYETEAESGEYVEIIDDSWPVDGYEYNTTLSKCQNGSVLSYDSASNSVRIRVTKNDYCHVYFDKAIDKYFSDYIVSLYSSDSYLYLHNEDIAKSANDGSYRYAGADPDNYVCFGSDEETCPSDNLYRIIGVFDNRVKLIKNDYAGSNLLGTDGAYAETVSPDSTYYNGELSLIATYYWNSVDVNTWSDSSLNTVNLNTNFLANIGSKWASMIDTNVWYVRGGTYGNIVSQSVNVAYDYELGANKGTNTYNDEIGLMYTSEYYYAASPNYWSNFGYHETDASKSYVAAIENNWIYMGYFDWTITPYSSNNTNVFRINKTGDVYSRYVDNAFGIRPTFFLKSEIKYNGSKGTKTDPYRIK